jgi:hypothetical protein
MQPSGDASSVTGGPSHVTSPTARQIHDDIERVLRVVRAAASPSERIGCALKSGGQRTWRAMKRHPFLAVVAMGVGGIAAASAVGAAELTFGAVLAFAAYKVLREGEPPLQALEEVERVVRG